MAKPISEPGVPAAAVPLMNGKRAGMPRSGARRFFASAGVRPEHLEGPTVILQHAAPEPVRRPSFSNRRLHS